jgi:hypothetical protein
VGMTRGGGAERGDFKFLILNFGLEKKIGI